MPGEAKVNKCNVYIDSMNFRLTYLRMYGEELNLNKKTIAAYLGRQKFRKRKLVVNQVYVYTPQEIHRKHSIPQELCDKKKGQLNGFVNGVEANDCIVRSEHTWLQCEQVTNNCLHCGEKIVEKCSKCGKPNYRWCEKGVDNLLAAELLENKDKVDAVVVCSMDKDFCPILNYTKKLYQYVVLCQISTANFPFGEEDSKDKYYHKRIVVKEGDWD